MLGSTPVSAVPGKHPDRNNEMLQIGFQVSQLGQVTAQNVSSPTDMSAHANKPDYEELIALKALSQYESKDKMLMAVYELSSMRAQLMQDTLKGMKK